MKKITALMLVLLMALTLCACGSSPKEDQAMLGTYQLYAMDYDENTTILASELFDGKNYITLKSGGSAEMCLEDDVANVKWKADGTKIVISAADGDMEGSLSGGILTLQADDTNLYFVGEGASTDGIKALTLDEMLNGVVGDVLNETPEAEPKTPEAPENPAPPQATDAPKPAPEVVETPPAQTGPTEVQQMWNGWYYGCIDMDNCTGEWDFLNGETFDAIMYVELDSAGKGRFAIYDPFGNMIENDNNNLYVDAECHADTRYLYGDSGEVFGCELNPSDWVIVHNLAIPEKLNVGSTSTNDDGETIGYDFQFKPWGDRWEGDNYTRFIPYFDSYIDAIDAGLDNPFGDTFRGFGIAEPAVGGNDKPSGGSDEPSGGNDKPSGGASALLGPSPAVLDVNDRGVVFVYYPEDQFRYDDSYGKLKNDETGVGILIDPMLGDTNFDELKKSYEENNSDEDDYSLTETTVNGYRAQIMKYTDWLGATMRVDVDFGGKHGNYYGISFAVSGDTLADCDTDLVWAIIESMEVAE